MVIILLYGVLARPNDKDQADHVSFDMGEEAGGEGRGEGGSHDMGKGDGSVVGQVNDSGFGSGANGKGRAQEVFETGSCTVVVAGGHVVQCVFSV